ncbi:hypothetical protein UFOVP1254_24 [uncultured Caudovirales phage]|uniref:Uncharacterized protein n=1 Tax=uncultured Caudovirales phage TaxID=2100421 RepID=A0A6J5RPX0_9CAUD|nr:hypothetical protein UFOVP1254_24 [uncultured Caudovirales phage]
MGIFSGFFFTGSGWAEVEGIDWDGIAVGLVGLLPATTG